MSWRSRRLHERALGRSGKAQLRFVLPADVGGVLVVTLGAGVVDVFQRHIGVQRGDPAAQLMLGLWQRLATEQGRDGGMRRAVVSAMEAAFDETFASVNTG